MNLKSTIIAFILAALSVLAVVFIQPADGPAARRAAHDVTALVAPNAFPVEDINRMTLTMRDQPTMVFERDAAGWKQTEPFHVHMDRYHMRQIINAVRSVEVLDRVPMDDEASAGLTLDAVSLDPPVATIDFAWSSTLASSHSGSEVANHNGNSVTFELGRTGIGGRGYLRRAGEDEVLVVSRHLHEYAVLGDPRGWRDRTLFRDVGVDSDRIERDAGDEILVLERDRRQWKMTEPVRTRVDENVRDVFMEALGGARSDGFIVDQPRDLSRFGLDPPVASLTVFTTRRVQPTAPIESAEYEEAETNEVEDVQRLLIGSPAGAGTQDRFAKMEGQPTIVRLPIDTLQRLFMQSGEMVSPTASGVMAADVKAIVINGPEGSFRIERDLDRWIVPEHDDQDVPTELADALLSQLTEARAERVSIHDYPHDLEVATITLHGFDNRPRDTVRIIQDPDTSRWGLENGDNVFRIFPTEIDLPLTLDAFGLAQE